MKKNRQGLTAIYNRFNDPREVDPGILNLRDLHGRMDHAVLEAYGWGNLKLEYGFYPDFEPTEDEDGEPVKVHLRYRWPNSLREEVLGCLLDLNGRCATEEAETTQKGGSLTVKTAKAGRKPKAQPAMASSTPLPYLIDPGE